TAVYQSLRKTADRYKGSEHEILGLTPTDQENFLQQALDGDENTAKELFKKIQKNIQVRLLAGNPFMLRLMAEVTQGDHGREIQLPASRAEFYREAVNSMWHRKLETD